MIYKQIKPAKALEPFIHCYWELKGTEGDNQWERNFPDGCAGLVMNVGDTCLTDNGRVEMSFGKTYAVGTTTCFKDSFIDSNIHLVGVCLKPAGFGAFYDYISQTEMLDQTVEFDKRLSFDLDKTLDAPFHYFNQFFTGRIKNSNTNLHAVLEDIHHSKGLLSMDALAKKNFTTIRQLQRNFKTHIGISPKEYSNIIRFQNALHKMQHGNANSSLLALAFECGYYDHSHLANDIKRHTGLTPSQL